MQEAFDKGDYEGVITQFTSRVAARTHISLDEYATTLAATNAARDFSSTRTIFSHMIDYGQLEPDSRHIEELAYAWSATDNPTEAMELLFRVMPGAGMSPSQQALEDVFASICIHADDLHTIQQSLDTLTKFDVSMSPSLYQSLMTSIALLAARNPIQSTQTRQAWDDRLDQVWRACVDQLGDDIPYETHVHYITTLNAMNRYRTAYRHLEACLRATPDPADRRYPGSNNEYPTEFSSTLRAAARAPILDVKFFERTLGLAAQYGIAQNIALCADVRRALPEMAHQARGKDVSVLHKMKDLLAIHRDKGWSLSSAGYNDVMRLCALMHRSHETESTELIDAALAQASHDGVPLYHTAYIAYLRHAFRNRRLEGVERGLAMMQEDGLTITRSHTFESLFKLLRFSHNERVKDGELFKWVNILRRFEQLAVNAEALKPETGYALLECYSQYNATSDVMRLYAFLRTSTEGSPSATGVTGDNQGQASGFLLPPKPLLLVAETALKNLLHRESMHRGHLKGEYTWSRRQLDIAIGHAADLWNDVLTQGRGRGGYLPKPLLLARIHAAGFTQDPDPAIVKRLASRTLLGKYGIVADHAIHDALAHHLAGVGENIVATKIACDMPKHGLKPTMDTWAGIAKGIATYTGRMEQGRKSGEFLKAIGELVIIMQQQGYPPNREFTYKVLDYLAPNTRMFKTHARRFCLLLEKACQINTKDIRNQVYEKWAARKRRKNEKNQRRQSHPPARLVQGSDGRLVEQEVVPQRPLVRPNKKRGPGQGKGREHRGGEGGGHDRRRARQAEEPLGPW